MLIPKKNIILIIYFIMSLYLTYCISNNCIKYYAKCETKINLVEQCNLVCKNGHLTHYFTPFNI